MPEDGKMTLDEFETGLARWGADIPRWPAPARAEGAGLLEHSEEARRLRDAAAALDAAFAAAREAPQEAP
ncbi:MAG: hypothetical protein ACK5MQ_11985, partial [Pikeienuella sp.]